MMHSFPNDTAVIIPARNEEARIGACLTALGRQDAARVMVILSVNNTTDRTVGVARDTAKRYGLHLVVLERTFSSDHGVGTARRIGSDHALRSLPDLQYILTTDADCIVAPDWIAQNHAHLEQVDAVCGKVGLITAEESILHGMDRHLATLEGSYRKLVQQFYACHAPGCADIAGTHGEAAGASLAFTKAAYLAVEGFALLKCGEDRHIVRALRNAGKSVRHADNVTVQASCRLHGRAAGGMSDALKARIGGADYRVDDCLPPADWLMEQAVRKTLGPWPPQVPTRFRLNVRDLPEHIKKLEKFTNSEGLSPIRIGTVDAVTNSHLGTQQPTVGSAIVPAGPDHQTVPPRANGMPTTLQPNEAAMPAAKGA